MTATGSPGPRQAASPRSLPGISRCSDPQAQWLSVSITPTPDLERVAALMEPGLCIAYRDDAGTFRQGVCSGALAGETTAPESFAALYRAFFRPGEPVSVPVLVAGNPRGVAVATFDPSRRSARAGARQAACSHHGRCARGTLSCSLCRAGTRAAANALRFEAGLKQLAANDCPHACPASILPNCRRSRKFSIRLRKGCRRRLPSATR